MSAFVFYYTLSQRSILSASLTDSMAYKYNNKDTQTIFVTHGSRCELKQAHLPGCDDIYLDTHICSFGLAAHFIHWFCFVTSLIVYWWSKCIWLIGGIPVSCIQIFKIVSRAHLMGLQLTGVTVPWVNSCFYMPVCFHIDFVLVKWLWLNCDFWAFVLGDVLKRFGMGKSALFWRWVVLCKL